MCQVQSVTLQTAVLMQVKEFAQSNKQFSVHDITRTIRNKASQGELEIPEVEVSGASFRFDIPHAKVKALFDELWRTGVFDPEFTLDRKFNGVYFEYTPSQQSYAGVSVSPTPTPAPQSTTAVPVPTVAPAPAHVSKSTQDVGDRVKTYLTNCQSRNFRPSLKQVQSAIKRDRSTGWSCEALKTYITGTLGYTVVDNPDNVSKAQVVTV